MQRGIATFTLDYGKCPKWLFERMVKLGREMTRVLIEEFGPNEYIKRIADPVWFQTLGTVLAFDWNASGLTTILTAALKEAIRGREKELGIFICGGKGKTSRRTPEEINEWGWKLGFSEGEVENLTYNSKMAAKVDSALVQDGYQIYHHSFFFSHPPAGGGAWSVVQQGMNPTHNFHRKNQKNKDESYVWGEYEGGTARRYHWFSENARDLVCEPHSGISSQINQDKVLNLVAKSSRGTREKSIELAQAGYGPLIKEINLIRRHYNSLSRMVTLENGGEQLTLLKLEDTEFKYHPVVKEDFSRSKYLDKILAKVTHEKPEDYEKLLATEGVGSKTMRALALVAEVVFGAKPSYEDPARFLG